MKEEPDYDNMTMDDVDAADRIYLQRAIDADEAEARRRRRQSRASTSTHSVGPLHRPSHNASIAPTSTMASASAAAATDGSPDPIYEGGAFAGYATKRVDRKL